MIGCIECITLYFVIPASVSGGCQLMVTLSLSAESTLSSRTDSGTKKKIRHKIINRLMTAEVILFAKWLWDSKPGHIGDRRVLPTLRLKVLKVSKCKLNATELSNKVKFWPRGVFTYVSHIGYVPPQRVRFLRYFCPKTVVNFAHFRLESGVVFEGTTGVYKRICCFNPKWIRNKE